VVGAQCSFEVAVEASQCRVASLVQRRRAAPSWRMCTQAESVRSGLKVGRRWGEVVAPIADLGDGHAPAAVASVLPPPAGSMASARSWLGCICKGWEWHRCGRSRRRRMPQGRELRSDCRGAASSQGSRVSATSSGATQVLADAEVRHARRWTGRRARRVRRGDFIVWLLGSRCPSTPSVGGLTTH